MTDSVQMDDVVEFAMSNFADSLDVLRVAQVAGLHPNYFITRFRSAIGIGFLEWLARYRVAQARGLLTTTDATVAEIARRVGFRHLRSFQRTFKRYTGTTATNFRKAYSSSPRQSLNLP